MGIAVTTAEAAATVSHFAAAAAMLALAGWLLWLNSRSPVNRSFAVFLVFRATIILANRMKVFADDAGHEDLSAFWTGIREYYYLALAPALAYFWVAYAGKRHRGVWLVSILAFAVAVEGAYMSDHCLNACTSGAGLTALGPLAFLANPGPLFVMGFVGLWVLRESLHPRQTPRARAAFPVAAGLLLAPLLEASIITALFLKFGWKGVVSAYEPSVWADVVNAGFLLACLPALVGLAWTVRVALRNPTFRTKAKVLVALAGFIVLSGVYVGWDWAPEATAARFFAIFLLGLWRILLPALVAYALVRHRLFGVDVRLRWTLVRATMALAFLGVFFVAAQLAQNYLTTKYGWGFGGVAAGLLLFTINPLQGIAERFVQTVLPHAKPVIAMPHPDRVALFRQQATLVWSDGAMGRKERALLDALRDRLGIPFAEAAHIEADAAKAVPS